MPYEVYALRYATRAATKAESYYRYAAYGEPDAEIGMDYFFWLLRDGATTILVDTGYSADAGARRGRTTLCPPLDALARADAGPRTIDRLILTHLHYDHTGAVPALLDKPITVHRRELEFWTSPLAAKAQLAPIVEPAEIAAVAAAPDLAVVDDLEANLAPGIEAACVGGHSPGQLVLVVETQNGSVVLASDAIHYYEELELDRPFEVFVDLAELYRGYETLRALAARPGAVLLAGHDPAVCERFPSDDGVVYRIA
jgi:glyoxylase-like metal-dependent hydrolase (beta-lactamase superfamily II)